MDFFPGGLFDSFIPPPPKTESSLHTPPSLHSAHSGSGQCPLWVFWPAGERSEVILFKSASPPDHMEECRA